jgi:hypothetical protein
MKYFVLITFSALQSVNCIKSKANYNSGNYLEALKMLSPVVGIFQAKVYFTNQNNPKPKTK